MAAMRVIALLVIAACWTGTAPGPDEPRAAAAPKHARPAPYPLEVSMMRTRCELQPCAWYEVTIAGDGTVRWRGPSGEVVTHVARQRLEELDRMITEVRFFELDGTGKLPSHLAACGPGQLCAFALCGNPQRATVKVRRADDTHAIDDELCGATTAAAPLEELIDQVANTTEWLAR